MWEDKPDGIESSRSMPGAIPMWVEWRVWPENVAFVAQQNSEGRWAVYRNDMRIGGRLEFLAFIADAFEAECTAWGAADAFYKAERATQKPVAN